MSKHIRSRFNPISQCKVPYSTEVRNDWLKSWFELNDLQYSHDGNHTILDSNKNSKKRRKLDIKVLFDILITDSAFVSQEKIKEILDAYISTWENREERKARSSILDKISFSEQLNEFNDIENFVLALTGNKDTLDIAIIKHFIWSVKRKMKGLKVVRHLFPILQGKQNSGKSTAVRKMLEPIYLFCSSRSLDMLNDSKELSVLTKKNVIWFDEMSKARKADVDAVKLHTTSETVSYRILYTHKEATAKNVSTFIGCTNKSVIDIFYDPTGSRRFYEFKCKDKINHALINKVNYFNLWKSIDENNNVPPIERCITHLELVQEKIKALDSVEEFMIEERLMPEKEQETMAIPFNELYQAYINWMTTQRRFSPFSKLKMGKRLTELSIATDDTRDTRRRVVNRTNTCGLIKIN